MSSFKIRPRFKHTLEGDKEDWENRLVSSLQTNNLFLLGHLPGHIYIKISPEHQHFWSPQLHVSFEQEEEHVIVRGLYGPNPTLWAIFFFGYVVLGLLTLFVGMWGLTRWSLGLDHNILWLIPAFVIAAIVLYFAAQAGQKLGAQQMFDIHHAYEDLVGSHVKVG
ncbi:MAG: hypothetical protein Tsb0034_03500 [Ekhidna sp.]